MQAIEVSNAYMFCLLGVPSIESDGVDPGDVLMRMSMVAVQSFGPQFKILSRYDDNCRNH